MVELETPSCELRRPRSQNTAAVILNASPKTLFWWSTRKIWPPERCNLGSRRRFQWPHLQICPLYTCRSLPAYSGRLCPEARCPTLDPWTKKNIRYFYEGILIHFCRDDSTTQRTSEDTEMSVQGCGTCPGDHCGFESRKIHKIFIEIFCLHGKQNWCLFYFPIPSWSICTRVGLNKKCDGFRI